MLKEWWDNEVRKGEEWREECKRWENNPAYGRRPDGSRGEGPYLDSPLLGNPIAYIWAVPQKIVVLAFAAVGMVLLVVTQIFIAFPLYLIGKLFERSNGKKPDK